MERKTVTIAPMIDSSGFVLKKEGLELYSFDWKEAGFTSLILGLYNRQLSWDEVSAPAAEIYANPKIGWFPPSEIATQLEKNTTYESRRTVLEKQILHVTEFYNNLLLGVSLYQNAEKLQSLPDLWECTENNGQKKVFVVLTKPYIEQVGDQKEEQFILRTGVSDHFASENSGITILFLLKQNKKIAKENYQQLKEKIYQLKLPAELYASTG